MPEVLYAKQIRNTLFERNERGRRERGMTRVRDVANAIEGMKTLKPTDENMKQMQLALLGHIAVCLAVIADKMSEDKAEGSEE